MNAIEQSINHAIGSDVFLGLSILLSGTLTLLLFFMTPFSNVLNAITVPLGYEWQSCPYCPEFGIKKITYTDCANCGTEITENFSTGRSPAGDSEMYRFCDRDCLDSWNGETA
jgi:hypothetical protein